MLEKNHLDDKYLGIDSEILDDDAIFKLGPFETIDEISNVPRA